jgi:cytochrome c-type biogenesis protein CcmH/NrfF
MALTQTDKNEIEVMIRKEIKSFLDSNTSKQFEDKLMDKISNELQRGKYKNHVKDIVIKSFQEYFNMMYHQKGYWESKFRNM